MINNVYHAGASTFHSVHLFFNFVYFSCILLFYRFRTLETKKTKHQENPSETIFHFEIGIVHPTATMRSELLNKIVENVRICFFSIIISFTNPVIVDKSLSMTKNFFASSRNSTKLILVTP